MKKQDHHTTVCAKCGKTLTNEPHHIDGIGNLGPECYRHVAGLESLLEGIFGVNLRAHEYQAAKARLDALGITFKSYCYNSTYRLTFVGFKQANRTPKGSDITFADIRTQFQRKLQAASAARHAVN